MNTESAGIADEIQRSLSGPAWHGSCLLELLAGVDDSLANRRVLSNIHTIHELVKHLTTWIRQAIGALHGKPMTEEPFPEDWPPTSEGADAWAESLRELTESTAQLLELVAGYPDSELTAIVPGRTYAFRVLLNGISQHAAYHGGQIALLKKQAAL